MSLKWDCLRLRPGLVCRRGKVMPLYRVEDAITGQPVTAWCRTAPQAWWQCYARTSPFNTLRITVKPVEGAP